MGGMEDMPEMGGDAEPPNGEMGSADEPFEPKDEFEREAQSFLDDSLPMAARVMALREAIKLCGEEDYGSAGSAEKKSPALAMIFGGKEKKG